MQSPTESASTGSTPASTHRRPRPRLVLNNRRVAVLTGLLCVAAAAVATVGFLDLAARQGQDQARALQISGIVAGFLGLLWLGSVLTLPRRRA